MSTDLYREMFGEKGLDVLEFEHAEPALKEIESRRFAAILMDLRLAPGMDFQNDRGLRNLVGKLESGFDRIDYGVIGIHVIRRARNSNSPNHKTPIVVHSVYDRDNDVLFPNAKRRALRAGADLFIEQGLETYHEVLEEVLKRIRSH